MNSNFQPTAIRWALLLAFSTCQQAVLAAEPFPALPPALSTSVAPNIMLYIDTSGSMLQNQNNDWILTNLCNSNTTGWSKCVNNYTTYRTTIDDDSKCNNPPKATDPAQCFTKMNIAKRVSRNLVKNNRNLRFGLFTFQDNKNDIGDDERSQAGKLRKDIIDVSSDTTPLINAINGVYGRTATPLAEGLLEITRYFEGKSSLYNVYSGNYVSPIQYRCQKNFVILITDGDATDDQNLPGTGQKGNDGNAVIASYAYTARDSDGKAVSPAPTFSVCTAATTTADNGYNVTCPSKYDGTSTSRDFGDATNRPSALRDVAMYANRADLRIGGTDGDGKSYDDPKFAKQNMITYTVGFAVANSVLPAAALVGGGKSYTATDEDTLANALNSAVSSIASSVSNAGGLATTTPYKTDGNKLFQPVFDPWDWHGELRCYDYASVTFDANNNIISGACTPNATAQIPAESSRKIYTSKWDGSATSFDFVTGSLSSMTTSQQLALGSVLADQQNAIKFLRGQSITSYRSRSYLLGDIVDSQPVVVAAPAGSSSDADYLSFKTSNSTRNMVFIGANDGMMHAFGVSDMKELMAYVPAAVYPHLADLTKADYGSTTPHTYHVNGEVRQSDLKLPFDATTKQWQTLLVGGLGQGGQGFYALNATSSSKLTSSASSAVKWEWNDQSDNEMGYSFGAPLIYNVRDSATTVVPAVILANGYENDYDDTAVGGKRKAQDTICTRSTTVNGVTTTKACNTGALYILNANTGALIRKISIPPRLDGIGGLSSPAGVDYGQDGILDYVYAGDVAGRLWRFDLTNASSASWSVSPNPIFDAGTDQPITLRPVIKPVTTLSGNSRGNLILFGTGKLLTVDDRTSVKTQSFYGVLDDLSPFPATIDKSTLLQRQIDVAEYAYSGQTIKTGTYRKITPLDSTSTFDLSSSSETKKGWYIDFPTSSERLVSSPILLDYMLLFGTGIPVSSQKCLAGGSGWLMGVDPMTGGVTTTRTKKPYSFMDIYLDGKSSEKDKVPFSSGSAYASGFALSAIPTELAYVSNAAKIVTPDSSGTNTYGNAGNVVALQDANLMSVYSGNAAAGTSKGNSQGNVGGDGASGGEVTIVTLGDQTATRVKPLAPPGEGYTVQTTTWRELLN